MAERTETAGPEIRPKAAASRAATTKGKRLREIAGVVAILAAVYLGVSLVSFDRWDPSLLTSTSRPAGNWGGVVGAYISDLLFSLIGITSFFLPVFLLFYGARKIMNSDKSHWHLAGFMLFNISFAMLMELIVASTGRHFDPAGGLAGLLLAEIFQGWVSLVGAFLVCVALLSISIILLSPVSIFAFILDRKERKDESPRQSRKPEPEEADYDDEEFGEDLSEEPAFTIRESRQKAAVIKPPVRIVEEGEYQLPSLDFLKEAEDVPGPTKEELTSAAAGLERKLADFGVNGKIRQAHPGPVVTMFEFEPAPGVKINRIVSLSDDLALSLRAPSIRVYPIAGKATIGLEVPNRQRAGVTLKEIIASEAFQKSNSLLTLALGKDIFGVPIVTDLARMPHLLVAGATGSGKSVSINAMIMSLLYKATPSEVKMLMIDPKLLELSSYADIPHLISPVITSPKEASDALKKIVFEMEQRYRLLAERGARNIDTYNRQVGPSEKLPYIVVFIDELADLMFTAPADVENCIARLAQMARASGIHLILATQRPSVDVITGLIKANFPARISFQVTTKIDSRTILDAMGAEQLLGKGDMLFMLPGVKMSRIHGAFVSDSEVREITEFVKGQGKPDYAKFESIVVADDGKIGSASDDERDETYQKVIDFAESAGEVSISSIQRRFKVGYNKAASFMELLEEDGFVGPPKGAGKPRDFIGRR